MKDGPDFRSELAEAKDNAGHLLVRCARLFNEAALRCFRARCHPEVQLGHLTLFPHIDLDGTRQSELVRRAQISKQAVGQHVDELERLGVVARQPDPADRRAKRVVFTDQGRATMLEGLGALAEVEAQILGGFSEEEKVQLRSHLHRVLTALEGA